MAKIKRESIKLQGRIIVSEGKNTQEDLEFVKQKLNEGIDQSVLVRKGIHILRLYESGELFQMNFNNIMDNFQKDLINSFSRIIEGANLKLVNVDETVKDNKGLTDLSDKEKKIALLMKKQADNNWF